MNRFLQALETHPVIAEVRKEADPKANIGSSWHTDHSYDQAPAMGSIPYAREFPSVGGDTLFASMYAAYDALSDGLKQMLLTMKAQHSSRHVFGEVAYVESDLGDLGSRLGNTDAAPQDSLHPVIIKHPLSGRSALYVNGDFTVKFAGGAKMNRNRYLITCTHTRAGTNSPVVSIGARGRLQPAAALTTATDRVLARGFDFVHVHVLLRVRNADPDFIKLDLDVLQQIRTHCPVVG